MDQSSLLNNMDRKRRRPSLRIVVKYFMLQLPGVVTFALVLLLVRHWMEFPDYLVWVLLGIWVGKDIFMFPILWRFYAHSPAEVVDLRDVSNLGLLVQAIAEEW